MQCYEISQDPAATVRCPQLLKPASLSATGARIIELADVLELYGGADMECGVWEKGLAR